jgi:membrane protein
MHAKIERMLGNYPRLANFLHNADEFFDNVSRHNIFIVAAGIAFNLLIYSLPLGLVVIFIVDKIFGVSNITPLILRITEDFLPPTPEVEKYVTTIVRELSNISNHSSITGVIGIIALLWLASLLISAIRNSLNTVLDLQPKHFFLLYRLKDMGLTVLLTVAVFIMLYVIPLFSFIQTFVEQFIPDFLGEIVSFTSVALTSIIFSFLVFLIIYSWVPHRKLPGYLRFWSSLVSAGTLELGRRLFGLYISGFSNYGKIYGTFAVLASLVLWLYYFSVIILLSAEIVKFIHDLKFPDRVLETEPPKKKIDFRKHVPENAHKKTPKGKRKVTRKKRRKS